MQSLGNIFISNCNKATRKRRYFPLSREVRENKQKERNRLPAHVTNVVMPMAKNIE